ncbi:MAG: universal stress protein [Chloroflexi bacterium]|nr:universal stress protein [Chloroflexota bacterium]
MFEKILVPLDGTPEAAVALPPVQAIVKLTHGRLTLLRIVPPPLASGKMLLEAETYLARVAEELASGATPTSTMVRTGDAAEEILTEVDEQEIDLVVMATHGRSGLSRALIGSVAQQVLAKSSVPVLLIRPGGHRMTGIETILVPVDGTPGGALALGAALGLARVASAKLVLLEVASPIPISAYGGLAGLDGGFYIDPSWDDEALRSAQLYVDGLAEKLRRSGIAAEGRAALGPVTETIAQTGDAVGANLIVMSTHALTGPARTILGSVADAVVRTGQRPVLLIRRGAHQRAAAEPRLVGSAARQDGGSR